ncbi:hypothetical protein AAFF_G00320710 [Aldrovandia affinis]|uniref:Uncharacterized protein n=1 Tax=Aldrovandia affinis TaxID=143900 RepID=A0AAD7R6X6_9TELE|nr:hypothetical protein AAFF_G00320710 [Aldrovandia affinis]
MLLGAECHPASLLLSAVNHVGFHSPGLGVSSAQYVVLNGVVGQSVAFPDAVKKSGSLTHTNHLTIGDVTGGQFRGFREGRVQWNSITGLFSISGLKMEDSGMYELVNNDGRSKQYQYQLNVGGADPLTTFEIVSIVTFVLFGCAVLGVLGYLGYRFIKKTAKDIRMADSAGI